MSSDARTIPIVCYAEDWGRLPSSTQHLMRGLSKTHPVLWVDSLGLRPPSATKGDIGRVFTKIGKFFSGVNEVEPNLFVMTPLVIPLFKYRLVRWLNRLILKTYVRVFLFRHDINEFLQWSSCPTAAIMLNALGELANIYYIGDEFSEFTQFDSGLVGQLERELLVRSDLLFVVSDRLARTKAQFNPLIRKIPHGCDYEHFSMALTMSNDEIPTDMRAISRPIVGFYGVLGDWCDFDMLKSIFSRHPEWSLVLIGPSECSSPPLQHLPNVHLLGKRSYEDLPRYLRAFNVCLVPYRKDSSRIINANPLKFLEYLASGRPVVSTDVPAIHPYAQGVSISETVDQLEAAIRTAIQSDSENAKATRLTIAKENSWQNRVSKVETLFNKHIYHHKTSAEKPVVLHLIAAMNMAGAEKVVLNLLSQKNTSKCDLRVTSFVRVRDGKGTDFLGAAAKLDTIIDKIPLYRGWDLRDFGRLRRLLKRHDVKLLHTHGYKSDIVGVIVSRLTGLPLVATAHGYTAADSKLQRNERIDRFFLRFANKVICVSDNVKESLLRSGLPERKTEIIPNGIDFDFFTKSADKDFRTDWKIGDREIIIGTAGRLSAEKAQINLVKAFAMLPPETRNNCRLIIAGSGPEKDAINSSAAELGLETSVTLTGFISDMRSFYQAIDIFCLPSLREASPLTILEAAASSRPVVTTRVGSVGNLIDDSIDGLIVQPGNLHQLSDALRKVIVSEELRRSFGTRLRKKLAKDHGIKQWAQTIFGIYEELLVY